MYVKKDFRQWMWFTSFGECPTKSTVVPTVEIKLTTAGYSHLE